jgi:metal-responsive CopG/Arc/MetJ family transcriptional regulator
MPASEKSGAAVKVELDQDLLEQLEAFRRAQRRIPSRAECLRRFLALGLANAHIDQHARF